jgi:hypothetical protein
MICKSKTPPSPDSNPCDFICGHAERKVANNSGSMEELE